MIRLPDDDEYCVRIISLPPQVKAFTSLDAEGFANIYVNALISTEEQRKALLHELRHIRRNDFTNLSAIRAIET